MSIKIYYSNELYHHGILGQKWGQRRWQNEDGSLTPEGRIHYGYSDKYKGKHVSNRELRKERMQLVDSYVRNDPRNNKATRLLGEAERLQKRYSLDSVNGTGGDRTRYTEPELRSASDRYLDSMNKYERMLEDIDADAMKKAGYDLIDKYGEERIKKLKTADTIAVGAIVASMYALPVAVAFASSR